MIVADQSAIQLVQLGVWILQGWMAVLVACVIAMALLFRRHGPAAEVQSPRAVRALRATIRLCGGRLIFLNVRRYFPDTHDMIFVGSLQDGPERNVKARPWIFIVTLVIVMLVLTPDSQAQTGPMGDNMLDDTTAFYVTQSQEMAAILKPLAKQLYGSLAIISFALFWIRASLNGSDAPSLVGKFALEILKAGFFLWVIDVGPDYLMQFMRYFTDAGSQIGQAGQLSPSGIVVLGFDTCFRTFDAIGRMGWGDTAAFGLPLALCGIAILVCFALVAILLMIRLIEMHMVIYGGILLLGFGGISFTRDIPRNYLSYAISCGAQLFMVYVLVGLGMQLADTWPASLSTDTTPDAILRQVLQLFVASLVFASLSWSIPKAAASLVNGSVSMGAADAFAPASAAAAGAAAGTAVATGGTSALATAAKGAVQAATAGTSLATQQGGSGVSAVLKGLGHAASSTAKEVGSAMKAKTGLAPPSPNATDHRGRVVDSLGTRAANDLIQQAQAEREAKAGAPSPQASEESGRQAIAESTAANHGSPAAPSGGAGSGPRSPESGRPLDGGAIRPGSGPRLAPPTLPPDTAPSSAVSIRIDNEE
ncbi:P-type conjugative transfer protein TrbL [Stenotrophomonas sp.]|uniref:P-type conjugative transfer protein TrbL n=1 Tax=Stenotrophomonas sp. TaxID=69392 RepID=UPI0028A6B0A0|nr:P-type conjugative transfer protein TrbL [Stenotrophomonas sp.]